MSSVGLQKSSLCYKSIFGNLLTQVKTLLTAHEGRAVLPVFDKENNCINSHVFFFLIALYSMPYILQSIQNHFLHKMMCYDSVVLSLTDASFHVKHQCSFIRSVKHFKTLVWKLN